MRYSVILNAKPQTSLVQMNRVWEAVANGMPPIGKAPLLELSYIRAAKAAPELLVELKIEIGLGINRLLQVFAYWLQELVEAEFIGIVEWTSTDVCRYHYFHRQVEIDEKRKVKQTDEFDESKPLGERYTYTTTEKRTTKTSRFLTRHVHHIVNARLHSLMKYWGKKPRRVKRFLSTVPSWLKPHLQVVSGTITMEEQIHLQFETTTVEEEILSVHKASPGVLLQPFNLIGWNEDDTYAESLLKKYHDFAAGLGPIYLTIAALAIDIMGPGKLAPIFRWIGSQFTQ